MITGILLTKIKAINLKSFHRLKEQAAIQTRKLGWKKNTNSVNYNGYSKKNYETKNDKILHHYPSSTRFYGKSTVSPNRNDISDNSDIDESLSALMGKVRHLHNRFHTKNSEVKEDAYSEKLNSKL